MSACLEVRGLSVSLGQHQVLRDLDLTLEAGQSLALVGESGSGKSTTALALMGLLPRGARQQGHILLDGQALHGQTEAQWRKVRGQQLSMIFQEPMSSLNPLMPVGEQVAEAILAHQPMDRDSCRQRVLELFDWVRIAHGKERIGHYPQQFSGGQRQRLMIAMAIACKPRLLIADEPTTALDATVQAGILALLDELRRSLSMSLLLITHDLGLVGRWSEQVVVMREGEALEQGTTQAIFQQPRHAYTRQLLSASLDLHSPRRVAPAGVTASEREPLLQVEQLRVEYRRDGRSQTALDGVSLSVAAGEAVGLVGESGCGKSTLSRTLMRLVEPSAGRALLNGRDILPLRGRPLQAMRSEMQMVFQDPYGSLNPRHRVAEILGSVLQVLGVARGERPRRIQRILDQVGLPARAAERYVHEFSGGQRQRLAIAKALLPEPQLLICDEPVSALDVSIQAQILDLLDELRRSRGMALLFISHDLAVVRHLCERTYVMQAGRLVEEGDQTLWDNPREPYTASLIAAVPQPRWATVRHVLSDGERKQ